MKYLKAALLCAVCMGILAFACYAPAGQEDLRDGDGISLYDIKDDYVIAELTEGQQDLARAVWTAIREGALGTVSVGMFELDEADARMVMNAVDLNYYPFGGGPALWMTPALAVRDGKEVHEFFVDVTKSREAIGLNERFMELCRKISRPYIKAGMSRRQILLELEKAVSDHMRYDLREKDPGRALVSGRGACGTYSSIYQGMCMSYGISCRYVIGYAKKGGSRILHAWNQVKLGRSWYYLDCCWDDCSRSDDYSLSEKLWPDHLRISYPAWFGMGG